MELLFITAHLLAFRHGFFFLASAINASYRGFVIIERIVRSHTQVASMPACSSRRKDAYPPSSTVAKSLCGTTGSSERFRRSSKALEGASGCAPMWAPTVSAFGSPSGVRCGARSRYGTVCPGLNAGVTMLRLDVTHCDQLMQVGPTDHGEDLRWRYGFTLFPDFLQNKEQLVRYIPIRSFRSGSLISDSFASVYRHQRQHPGN